jgi:hypothetical protein
VEDDELGMMFMTCHPALSQEARVTLTPKVAGGFSVGEIARAFLVEETAIAQRLVRAKQVLRDRDVAFGPPDAAAMGERLDSDGGSREFDRDRAWRSRAITSKRRLRSVMRSRRTGRKRTGRVSSSATTSCGR